MKKSLPIAALFLFGGLVAHAQKEVLFKMRVKPNHDYLMDMKMNMNMVVGATGDTASINKLKQSGQSFPMVMDMQMTVNMDLKTTKLNASNRIPFTMQVKPMDMKMTLNGKETPVPMPKTETGTIYGTYNTEGALSLDSIAGQKTSDAAKELTKKMLEGFQAQIKFPENPMKIGDTFTQSLPMNLPMAGLSPNMKAQSVYTLKAIEGNKAYFDMKMVLDMGMKQQGINMTMSGAGDGKLVYDIAASYGTSMNMNMDMSYSMAMPQAENATMNGKMKMRMEYSTVITNN